MYRKDETATRWREMFSSADGGKIKEALFNSQSNTYENMKQAMEERFKKKHNGNRISFILQEPLCKWIFSMQC